MRSTERLLEAIDARVAELRRTLPYTAYGVVDVVDAGTTSCSVFVSGDSTASEGFFYPPRMSDITAGDHVRVVVDPRGDRYVQENLTR